MNTYCDDCKRCTGGNMRKSDVPGGDDYSRCWECEATIQAGMAEADAMISDLRAERDALRERCEKLEWLVEVQEARKSRVWLMIIWQRVEREKTMSLEQQRVGHSWAHNCLDELYKAALAATEEK